MGDAGETYFIKLLQNLRRTELKKNNKKHTNKRKQNYRTTQAEITTVTCS